MEPIVIALSVVFGISILGVAAYLTYVIRVRLQWNFILREAALASTKALNAFTAKIAEQKANSFTSSSEAIRKEISNLLKE